uniref:Uncharacterized protein n=1 Tax=Siphoviridae sp. ctu9a31 TaxID=2825712 RepID=A0A8S5Q9Z6_9CAUD|nr:MAG TPA: hypothetical protein [Siphoviridae sp. ctu9a31]
MKSVELKSWLYSTFRAIKKAVSPTADSQKLQYHLNKRYRYYITLIKLMQ